MHGQHGHQLPPHMQYGHQQQPNMGYGGHGQFQQPTVDKDQQLRNLIDQIYMKYDRDGRGTLEENEFGPAIGDICQQMGIPPPQSYGEFIQIAR